MKPNCVTCEFAERDEHGRFMDRCAGFGNCDYQEYHGEVKDTLREYLDKLLSKYIYGYNRYSDDYITGVRDALSFVGHWDENE